jgi:hypothetical protein
MQDHGPSRRGASSSIRTIVAVFQSVSNLKNYIPNVIFFYGSWQILASSLVKLGIEQFSLPVL